MKQDIKEEDLEKKASSILSEIVCGSAEKNQ